MTSPDHLLQDDEQARSDALDVTRSFIVQAPAGSGKTELLIQRYLKLLSTVENPEEVLAITFTRKAAAEMRQRVLESLRSAKGGDQPDEAHRRLTTLLATDVLRREAEWQLLANPGRMRIQTLDSLNAMIARARPLSAPQGASGVRIVTDSELRSLYGEAAIATLDWLTEEGDVEGATRSVLTHVDNNTSLYVAYLSQMLATRDQWLPFVGTGQLDNKDAGDLRRRLEGNLADAVAGYLRTTAASIPPDLEESLVALSDYSAGQLREAGDVDHPVCALAGIDRMPAPEPGCLAQWWGFAELLLTKTGRLRSRVDKRQGFPPKDTGQKQAMLDVLESLADGDGLVERLHGTRLLPEPAYSDDQWAVLLALFRLLPLAVTELQRLFGEQGSADYIEIALTAGGLLGTADQPGDIALLLDYRVSHILIDEMQDTSSAQYRMLEALTGGWTSGDGRTLFCVGDPMQSIYRFRNAEVGQFLLARDGGIGDVQLDPLVLRRNFRSGAHLVDWFNSVFPSILAGQDDAATGAVSYSEAISADQLAGIGDCVTHPLFGGSVAQEANVGCKVVVETLRRYPDDDMAVLVRSRTQLPALLSQLRDSGIDYRAVDIDRLTDLPEIIEVLALTRAAVHQGDRLAWLGVLRAPWIGLDWCDLLLLARNDSSSTVWELLQDEERIGSLSQSGREAVEAALPALRTLVEPRPSQGLRSLVEQCWMTLGGPAILADEYAVSNVYRFLDVLSRYEVRGSLDDVATLEVMLDAEHVSSDRSARLQVMTMHRAKGLEFDHVLLYGLGRVPRGRDQRVLSWLDVPGEHGEERKIISPVGPRAVVERDAVHRFIDFAEAQKDRNEQARLLYVACTRARKTLNIMGHVSADDSAYRAPASRSLLSLLWAAAEPRFAAAFEPGTASPDDGGDAWLLPTRRRFEQRWRPPAVTGLPGRESKGSGDEEEVEFYWVGTGARIAGTIVHRWLHLFAERGAPDVRADPTRHGDVTRRWLEEYGVADEMAGSIEQRVGDALHGVLADERGRWLLDGDGDAELPLSGIHEGQLESVILDRVRIDDDGVHWIVDYKTSTHEGGDLEGFLQAEARRYAAQLHKYAGLYEAYAGTTPRRALYFPLLQTFVEV